MCGIAGIISSRGPVDSIEAYLKGLVRDLHHRGPDDRGIWISKDNHVGLAATRLAIIDLSPAGHQPMSSADERYTIVFNGEIYNFGELRTELLSRGVQFRSHSDTEVILQLYGDVGATCVSRLRGMFAFAIWDQVKRTCFLARDPLGIKPLYYFCDEERGIFLFGSELKPLLRTGFIPKKLSAAGLFGFFRCGSVPEPYTLIEKARCLEAGSTILWQDGKANTYRYWQIQFDAQAGGDNANYTESKAVAVTRKALLDSVSHHFVSDVPVGIFLSGGIDSTAIVALARASGQKGELRSFSIGTDDALRNEAGLARRTADHFGTNHAELMLNAQSAKPLFEEFLQSIDQPTVDGFNTFVVSKLAHEAGMKVVLSGLGGDEIFGGYTSFTRLPGIVDLNRHLRIFGPLKRVIGKFAASKSPDNRWRRFGEFLAGRGDLVSAYFSFRGICTTAEANGLIGRYIAVDGDLREEVLLKSAYSKGLEIHDAVSKLEIEFYMRNQLLRDSDVMSMAWELELRVPFVDRCLVDTVTKIPANLRLQERKALLIKSIPELPQWIWQAPKRGFLLPFEKWSASQWFPKSAAAVSDGAEVRLDSWYQKWTVSIFENWLEEIA